MRVHCKPAGSLPPEVVSERFRVAVPPWGAVAEDRLREDWASETLQEIAKKAVRTESLQRKGLNIDEGDPIQKWLDEVEEVAFIPGGRN